MSILSKLKTQEQLPHYFWYVTVPLMLLMGNAWIVKTSGCGAFQKIRTPGFNYEVHSGSCDTAPKPPIQ